MLSLMNHNLLSCLWYYIHIFISILRKNKANQIVSVWKHHNITLWPNHMAIIINYDYGMKMRTCRDGGEMNWKAGLEPVIAAVCIRIVINPLTSYVQQAASQLPDIFINPKAVIQRGLLFTIAELQPVCQLLLDEDWVAVLLLWAWERRERSRGCVPENVILQNRSRFLKPHSNAWSRTRLLL